VGLGSGPGLSHHSAKSPNGRFSVRNAGAPWVTKRGCQYVSGTWGKSASAGRGCFGGLNRFPGLIGRDSIPKLAVASQWAHGGRPSMAPLFQKPFTRSLRPTKLGLSFRHPAGRLLCKLHNWNDAGTSGTIGGVPRGGGGGGPKFGRGVFSCWWKGTLMNVDCWLIGSFYGARYRRDEKIPGDLSRFPGL